MADIILSDMQTKGANQVKNWYRSAVHGDFEKFTLAGYAGSGKTSILPYIIDHCGLNWQDVTFCAPTGKAAKVLSGKLQGMYQDKRVVAKTIHSQIYVPLKAKVEKLRDDILAQEKAIKDLTRTQTESGAFDPAEFSNRVDAMNEELRTLKTAFDDANRLAQKNGPSFVLNTESAINNSKLIVVDEASMVGEGLTDDLFTFGVPVLAIGDPAQLPPVGDNPGLMIGNPDFFLTEIHRQAADNPIIRLSMDIREGKRLTPGKMGEKVRIVKERNDQWTENPDYDAQVLCGTHKTRWILTKRVRDMCGYEGAAPQVGEPLMVCKNSKKIPTLVNGSFVECIDAPSELYDGDAAFQVKVRDETGVDYGMQVYQGTFEEHQKRQRDAFTAPKFAAFDSKRMDEILDFGWVITTHKSQGSQWDNVIVHDESQRFREDADKWLYTAVTRAADELTVVVT